MALIIVQLVLMGKYDIAQLETNIQNTRFDDETASDYFAKLNYEHFLATIYFQLKAEKADSPQLFQMIEEKLAQAL